MVAAGALCSLAACLQPGIAAGAADSDPGAFAGRYVVVYKAGHRAKGFSVAEETAQREYRLGFRSRLRYRHAVKGFTARLSDAQVRTLERDPEVALVTADRPLKAATVGLAAGDQIPTGVSRIGSAISGTVREQSGIAVAVLDSGIDLAHPDLNAQSGANCVAGGPALDDSGHGTQVAGVIGARNNGAGVVGVAPGTKLFSVKVLDQTGDSSTSRILCGIDWVTANAAALGIKVANLSLQGLGPISTCATDPLHLAVCNSTAAGVIYVAAAGNSAGDIGTTPYHVPASFPEVLTVTAMADSDGQPGGVGVPPACPAGSGQSDDRFASFSNYALSAADASHTIAAPGVCVQSTAPGGSYDSFSGTSAAAPHVAATVALCLNEGGRDGPCGGLRPAEVTEKIRTDAARTATAANGFFGDPINPIDVYYGFLVSVVESTKPKPPSPPPPPPPPIAPTESQGRTDRAVSFRVLRIQSRGDRLHVFAHMDEAGMLTATGSVRVSRRNKPLHRFRRAAKRTLSPGRIRLVLRLTHRSRRVVGRALRGGHRLTARIVVRAADTAGNSDLVRRAVRLRP